MWTPVFVQIQFTDLGRKEVLVALSCFTKLPYRLSRYLLRKTVSLKIEAVAKNDS